MNKLENIKIGRVEDMRTFAEVYSGVRINKLFERAIRISADIYSHAKKHIKIVCGRLNSRFYNDKRIVEALKKAYKNGAKIEIICGPKVDQNTNVLTEMCKDNILDIWQREKWPEAHFWVVDGKNIRLEEPHSTEFQEDTEAMILSDARPQAEELLRIFEGLKKESRKTCILDTKLLAGIAPNK